MRGLLMSRRAVCAAVAGSSTACLLGGEQRVPICDGSVNVKNPTVNIRRKPTSQNRNGGVGGGEATKITIDSLTLVTGTAHRGLTEDISQLLGVPICNASTSRFADGEVSIQILDNIRGKDCVVVQSCAAPVNDSIMELLLTVSCLRRSGARRVVAVIPYFGYKHHRRGAAISTKHQSRFLSSGAMDFAKMLQVMGVDRVISVDLQRPGQGHEACFFESTVPLEVINTNDLMVNHFSQNVKLTSPVVVVTPNAECFKKARKFQLQLQKALPHFDIKLAAFFSADTGSGPTDTTKLELIGSGTGDKGTVDVTDADVIIVDDMVDTAGTLFDLTKRLDAAGARAVRVCASHGLFTEKSMELIQSSPKLLNVVVTNSLPLPVDASSKVSQVKLASLISHVILAEHFRTLDGEGQDFDAEDFTVDLE